MQTSTADHPVAAPERAQNEHTAAARLSPSRIRLILATIGWTERELARRTGNHPTTVRRWLQKGLSEPALTNWLQELEQHHRNHPCPNRADATRTIGLN